MSLVSQVFSQQMHLDMLAGISEDPSSSYARISGVLWKTIKTIITVYNS